MQFLKPYKIYTATKILRIFLFSILLLVKPFSLAAQKYTVVLDAGHGGRDPGNLGNGFKEKKIALKVVLAIGKELQKNRDIKVVYTRKKDVFVELHNRAKIANNKKADLFVSVHCDSHGSDAHGAGTFVLGLNGNSGNLEIAKRENAVILLEDDYKKNYDYDPNSPESVIGLSVLQEENLDNSLAIADLIQYNFSKIKRYDRKVKQANFLVLRETVMPSVLIELGFLTNKAEGRFLNTKSGQLKMAKSIAIATEKYIKRLRLNTVVKQVAKTKIVKKNKKVIPKVIKKKEVHKKNISTKKKVQKGSIIKSNSKVKEKGQVIFKVQVAASRKILTDKNFNFKGLTKVETMRIDGYYKYYYGSTDSYLSVKQTLAKVRGLGYKGAFVVAFKNGKKISLKEARKK
ncbi:N-acetylmuramoyl-L-alanine amidase [Tenacibaculum maritimum]|uniref:N-acetylmuramoyl-L-alanine amidase family protein n=1 Tax=Tenacibaculum maritimum TaxID=107401 RepID=UPI0012E51642|nr:N-acetylmuramoyl-L-alanine amidase [Tenacibaculum maritimum]MCD9581638.1 N-acetylmuramoyl-L-alanine amidase [Tenacibaculum maritimum]MCD9636130.1 N-acetylmuramoyl-L-alanine amidase [Tenacibaculum maritimum]CAA0175534.1 putative N-acetylmuramoyl-L-alanine amidase [Tenacibaculum maritimum]CAA0176064.1 putative N-acetylmuramoyl-L-alanine amidase [Tenacibaculum maritimum]CAA0180196.1 putative N-acetylmuramoyl-L-alanine amidase [Tenacibaculum maritimum]